MLLIGLKLDLSLDLPLEDNRNNSKIKPILKGIQDDSDWIQVSDDDEDEDMIGDTKKWVRPKALTTNVAAQQSYLFTNSG